MVTLKGKNLDISNTQKIFLNEVEYDIIKVASQMIECLPGQFTASNKIKEGNVTLQINNTMASLESSYFRYRPDAYTNKISINSTLAAISSITFFGKNLASFFKPKIKANFVN